MSSALGHLRAATSSNNAAGALNVLEARPNLLASLDAEERSAVQRLVLLEPAPATGRGACQSGRANAQLLPRVVRLWAKLREAGEGRSGRALLDGRVGASTCALVAEGGRGARGALSTALLEALESTRAGHGDPSGLIDNTAALWDTRLGGPPFSVEEVFDPSSPADRRAARELAAFVGARDGAERFGDLLAAAAPGRHLWAQLRRGVVPRGSVPVVALLGAAEEATGVSFARAYLAGSTPFDGSRGVAGDPGSLRWEERGEGRAVVTLGADCTFRVVVAPLPKGGGSGPPPASAADVALARSSALGRTAEALAQEPLVCVWAVAGPHMGAREQRLYTLLWGHVPVVAVAPAGLRPDPDALGVPALAETAARRRDGVVAHPAGNADGARRLARAVGDAVARGGGEAGAAVRYARLWKTVLARRPRGRAGKLVRGGARVVAAAAGAAAGVWGWEACIFVSLAAVGNVREHTSAKASRGRSSWWFRPLRCAAFGAAFGATLGAALAAVVLCQDRMYCVCRPGVRECAAVAATVAAAGAEQYVEAAGAGGQRNGSGSLAHAVLLWLTHA